MPSAFPPLTLQESQGAKLHRCVHASFSASAQFQGRNLHGKHKANESILLAGTFPYSEVHFVISMLCQGYYLVKRVPSM